MYATAGTSPQIVPVPLQDGKEAFEHIDDLEVNFWVNNVACNRFVVSTTRFRKTFHAIPDHPTLPLPFLYSIIREDPQAFPLPNALVKEICPLLATDDGLKGNILVVKHTKNNKNNVLDMTEADIQLVNLLLQGYVAESHVWFTNLTACLEGVA